MGWKIHQIDVKTTILNGKLKEEVYIEQPEGFVAHKKEAMCVEKKEHCIESSRLPEHGMRILMHTCRKWAL